jgi:hypothetical protein
VKGNALADSTALSVTLPQAIVEDIVKAEIVRHLGKCDELVGSIIGSVMSTECKCDKHRYSHGPKRSVFACELEKQIEQACKDIVSGWIAENREKFKAELTKRLAKPDQLRALVSSFAEGINAGSWHVQVNLKEKRD